MKNNFSLLVCFFLLLTFGVQVSAQELGIRDTIYANDQNQEVLFFPSPIRQAITGNQQGIFTYNKDKLQHFGLLQVMEGAETNLLVIDQQGMVYSFLLKYRERLPQYLHFFRSEDAVGTERPVPVIADSVSLKDNSIDWKVLAEQYMKTTQGVLRRTKNSDIVFRLRSLIFHKEVFFLVMEIENDSKIPYQPDHLLVSRNTRKQGKRKAMQRISVEKLETYSFPDSIEPGQKKQFMVILPKFTIPSDCKLQLELFEKNGSRKVALEVYQRHLKKVQYR